MNLNKCVLFGSFCQDHDLSENKEKGDHDEQYCCDSLETPALKHDNEDSKPHNKPHERILHNINPAGDCNDMSFKELYLIFTNEKIHGSLGNNCWNIMRKKWLRIEYFPRLKMIHLILLDDNCKMNGTNILNNYKIYPVQGSRATHGRGLLNEVYYVNIRGGSKKWRLVE